MALLSLIAIFSFFISPALCSTNALFSSLGGRLSTGESLVYNDYTLKMQEDCNLVIYDKTKPTWASNTYRKAINCYLVIEPKGELIIRGIHLGRVIRVWSSNKKSEHHFNHALVLKYDGTLHVYGPNLWVNPSLTTTFSDSLTTTTASTTDSILWSGDVAPIGVTIVRDNIKLELSKSCDLILTNTETNAVLWHTDTTDHLADCFVSLAGNGELFIKYLGGDSLWRSGVTSNYSDYVLALQPDSKLVIYGPVIWSSENAKVMGNDEKIVMVTNE